MLSFLVWGLAFEPLDIPNDKCGVAVSAHEDDRLIVFAMGQDQQIYHKYQMPLGNAPTADGFTYWSSMGGKFLGGPSVVRDASSKLVLFARGADKGIWMKQQASQPIYAADFIPSSPAHICTLLCAPSTPRLYIPRYPPPPTNTTPPHLP